jgi:membrane-bound ClpP family serine protease
MSPAQPYVVVAIAALAAVAIIVLFANKGASERRLSPLAGLAFALVIAGIVFGGNRMLGYSLIGLGVLLALYDMWTKRRR